MTVLAIITSSLVVVISLIILCILHALPTGGSAALGFSTKLIHRDSPESPLHDPTSTPFSNSRLLTTIRGKSIYFDGRNYNGTYMVEVNFGMPPQRAFFGVSTSSRFSWVVGDPCNTCRKLKVPFFNPKASTTYNKVTCMSKSCRSIRQFPCDSAENLFCMYKDLQFGRYITANGNLAKEIVHFKNTTGTVSVRGIILGFTHGIKTRPDLEKMIWNNLGSGYMELSNHELSLINQLHDATDGEFPRKLSYCIPLEVNRESEMYLGDTPPSRHMSDTTPLYISHGNHYYLHLISIDIGFKHTTPVHIAVTQEKGSQSSTEGNILVDTASPITFIRPNLMKNVERILEHVDLKRVAVPKGLDPVINICFDWNERNENKLPDFYFTFENHAVIIAGAVFKEVEEGVICALMASNKFTTGSASVLGSAAQIGHRFEFDLEKKEVKITSDNCESRKSN